MISIDLSSPVQPAAGSLPHGPCRRNGVFSGLLLTMLVLWTLQLITGFRSPASPIVVSDADSGAAIRQMVFGLSGLVGAVWIALFARIDRVLAGRAMLLLLMATVYSSAVYSENAGLTIKRAIILTAGMLLLAAVIECCDDPRQAMLRFVTLVSGAAAWVSIIASKVLPAASWSIEERPGLAGVTGHPNQLGTIMAIGLIMAAGLQSRTLGQWCLHRLAQAGCVIGLLMSQSMTSLAFALVGIVAYVVLRASPGRRTALALVVIPVAMALAVVGTKQLKQAGLSAAGRDATLSGRTELWAVVWQQVYERPLLGSGYGAFWREGRGRELVHTWNPRQSHQAYVDLMLDLGVVGLALVLLLVVSAAAITILKHSLARTLIPPADAALIALLIALCGIYSFGESFLLKADKFPFFIMMWALLLLTHAPAPSRLETAVKRGQRDTQLLGSLAG
jgi:exopolysaccharide production protein ExoQ